MFHMQGQFQQRLFCSSFPAHTHLLSVGQGLKPVVKAHFIKHYLFLPHLGNEDLPLQNSYKFLVAIISVVVILKALDFGYKSSQWLTTCSLWEYYGFWRDIGRKSFQEHQWRLNRPKRDINMCASFIFIIAHGVGRNKISVYCFYQKVMILVFLSVCCSLQTCSKRLIQQYCFSVNKTAFSLALL